MTHTVNKGLSEHTADNVLIT